MLELNERHKKNWENNMKIKISKLFIITSSCWLFFYGSLVFASDTKPELSKYSTEQIHFETNGLKLEGDLFLPKTKIKIPGIVMVCGSGPINRDGEVTTIQTNEQFPFYKVWADYLSSHHIATFRFDKRYITHKSLNPLEITQDDQIKDIISAVKYLQTRNEIDQSKIFILGHSEGGTIAPVAASQLPNIAGVIIMASPSIPIDYLFVEQLKANHSPYVEATKNAFVLLKENKFPKDGQIWGGGETYWREWIEYTENVNTIVERLNRPTLVLQGLTDENYPQKIFQQNIENWKKLASNSKVVVFMKYPNTTHRFLTGNTDSITQSAFDQIIQWVSNL